MSDVRCKIGLFYQISEAWNKLIFIRNVTIGSSQFPITIATRMYSCHDIDHGISQHKLFVCIICFGLK